MKQILTPVEQRNGYWFKRDDYYKVVDVCGGKARTCWYLATHIETNLLGTGGLPLGLVTAGHRQSPQANIVAQIAQHLKIPCRIHTPTGPLLPELQAAQAAGAKVIQHAMGYNSVICARAKQDAEQLGYRLIPFGMECWEAVQQTRVQVQNMPRCKRIVLPVGSAMSLCGVLWGLKDYKRRIPVLGIVVGPNPATSTSWSGWRRIRRYAPPNWQSMATLVHSGVSYHAAAKQTQFQGIELDPIYEAKCIPFLCAGDLLWIVGRRQT